MKKHNDDLERSVFFKALIPSKPRVGPLVVSLGAFVVSLGVIIAGRGYISFSAEDLRDFEVGRVADRDVTAEQTVSYVDQAATRQKLDALERLVPAVFTYSAEKSEAARNNYRKFSSLVQDLLARGASTAAFQGAIEEAYPGFFSPALLETLYQDSGRELPGYGFITLDYLLETGVFALPWEGEGAYNGDFLELRRNYDSRTEQEQIPYARIITPGRLEGVINRYAAEHSFPASFALVAAMLVGPFVTENAFFSPEDTRQRIAESRDRAGPVVKYIERGKKIVRKGFIVTEEDMIELEALSTPALARDVRALIGQILVLILLYGLILFLTTPRAVERLLKPAEVYLLCITATAYIIAAVFVRGLSINEEFPAALFLPTALAVMLPAILIGPRPAMAMALALPLAAFLSGAFDNVSYILALTSAVAAAYALQGTERRIDLVKAGLISGAANAVAAVAALLIRRASLGTYPPVLFWAVFNGVVSGILALGFLPLLEHALNSVTSFRLVELSDLNSPILKRLFSVAPGTYSHSLMVANLAEAACQEIGANPLLARVGAYYHDIGKMDNPDYFVENQTVYNKHEDIAPRLSATVIRSHVKLGVEKARSLGLPKEVTDIIAEHHGNSVISWFYHEALKRENPESHSKSGVNMEDFAYPGSPPRSRESAVVMLADVTEAAVRTLKRPSASRLEKYIQELIMAKFEHGQLSESELTFRDLETIKKAFVRVLAGHYHARIEYPKMAKEVSASTGGHE
jgi:putative nucleotidyltransferase with HDIG domain